MSGTETAGDMQPERQRGSRAQVTIRLHRSWGRLGFNLSMMGKHWTVESMWHDVL